MTLFSLVWFLTYVNVSEGHLEVGQHVQQLFSGHIVTSSISDTLS